MRCEAASQVSMSDDTEQGGSSNGSRRREEKARKKDSRSWENVMKSMGDVSDGEKLVVVKEKYTALYTDYRAATNNSTLLERKYATLQRERDQVRAELNKNILAKSKLESLCRELQKQNKAIKDENITRMKEEEEKRREVATIFTERLNSLSSMMDENKDKSFRLREENMNMTIKLSELYAKFQERENLLANLNRQLDVQKDLFESKIKKIELEYKSDRNVWEEETKSLLTNLLKSNETNRLLEENIRSMQANLDVYKNQYSDFEQTMSRSNEVFKTFHGEINKLQKSNTALEKEKCDYITKWKSCHNSVVEISEKNQQLVKKLELTEKKVGTLEKLCRQLQAERNTLHKQLQQDKGNPVASPQEDEHTSTDASTKPKQNDKEVKKSELPSREIKSVHNHGTAKAQGGGGEDTTTSYTDDETLVSEPTISGVSDFSSIDPLLLETKSMHTHLTHSEAMEFSDIDLDPTYSTSAPQFTTNVADVGSNDELEGTRVDMEAGSEIYIKEAKSVPITRKEHESIDDENFEEPQTSTGDLTADLSLESVPLYKPAAVTDVPTQGGHVTLVKESEGYTNILEASSSTELSLEDPLPFLETDSSLPSVEIDSSGITLKGSEGKTELTKK